MVKKTMRKKVVFVAPDDKSEDSRAPMQAAVQPLTSVFAHAAASEVIVLNTSIHWQTLQHRSASAETDLIFKIWRGLPSSGALVCSVRASCSGENQDRTIAFTHVDIDFEPSLEILYTLTAEASQAENKPQKIECLAFTATAYSFI